MVLQTVEADLERKSLTSCPGPVDVTGRHRGWPVGWTQAHRDIGRVRCGRRGWKSEFGYGEAVSHSNAQHCSKKEYCNNKPTHFAGGRVQARKEGTVLSNTTQRVGTSASVRWPRLATNLIDTGAPFHLPVRFPAPYLHQYMAPYGTVWPRVGARA